MTRAALALALLNPRKWWHQRLESEYYRGYRCGWDDAAKIWGPPIAQRGAAEMMSAFLVRQYVVPKKTIRLMPIALLAILTLVGCSREHESGFVPQQSIDLLPLGGGSGTYQPSRYIMPGHTDTLSAEWFIMNNSAQVVCVYTKKAE